MKALLKLFREKRWLEYEGDPFIKIWNISGGASRRIIGGTPVDIPEVT